MIVPRTELPEELRLIFKHYCQALSLSFHILNLCFCKKIHAYAIRHIDNDFVANSVDPDETVSCEGSLICIYIFYSSLINRKFKHSWFLVSFFFVGCGEVGEFVYLYF